MQNNCRSCGEVFETSSAVAETVCPACGAVNWPEGGEPGSSEAAAPADPSAAEGLSDPGPGVADDDDGGEVDVDSSDVDCGDGGPNDASLAVATNAAAGSSVVPPDVDAAVSGPSGSEMLTQAEEEVDEDEEEEGDDGPQDVSVAMAPPEAAAVAAHPRGHAPRSRLAWLAVVMPVLAVVLAVWFQPGWLQSASDREVKKYRLNVIYSTPSVFPTPDPLKSESDPDRRRALAAQQFVEFYWFNVSERPEWCLEQGVDMHAFPVAFARIHQSELRVARRLLDPSVSEDMVFNKAEMHLQESMASDMKRLGRELGRSARATCNYVEDHAEDVAWRMHIAAASPAVNGILREASR